MPGLDIRPTSDRLRETLFNVLTAGNSAALEGSVWVDLFAGTGAVGIEALSRGAAMVYFVEHSREAALLIQQNLGWLKINQGFRVFQQEAGHAIPNLNARGVRADFVFLDPPYRMQSAYREALDALSGVELARNAVVVAEHEKRFDPGEKFGDLTRRRELKQGDGALSFYGRVLTRSGCSWE